MPPNLVALKTIVRKEVIRFTRIWMQSLLPPVITISLYFTIFGHLIGSQIHPIRGFSYLQFIAPGLIMMFVITNAYSNVVSSFYSTRFMRSVEEILVSPCPNYILLLGYILGGLLRGLAVGLIVTTVSLFFTHLHLQHPGVTLAVVCLSALLFALAGFTNAVFANSFDDISIIPTFVLTPLTYLGGVFYSVDMLPEFWQKLSYFNPILYMVNGFRYGILGLSDVSLGATFSVICAAIVALFCLNVFFLKKGIGLRT
jgi:ABC-2 type transport system permease protein